MSLNTKIRSMIRRGIISLLSTDDGDHQIIQASYLGKTARFEAIFPFGMGGNPPKDAQVLLFNVEAMEENRAGIATLPKSRFKLGKKVETWFGNPVTGSVMYYRENGNIEIIGKNGVSVTVDGDMDITVAGTKTISAITAVNINSTTAVNVTAPAVGITGNATITGNAIITGALSVGGKDFTSHVHAAGTPPGNTGPVV